MITSVLTVIGGLAALIGAVSQVLRLQGKEWPSRGWKSFNLGWLADPKEQLGRPAGVLLAAGVFAMVAAAFGQTLSLWSIFPVGQLLWASIGIAFAHVMHAATVWYYKQGEPFLDGLWLTLTLTVTGIASAMFSGP